MQVKYLASINKSSEINSISTKSEICIFGRSNVGKSSLINALTLQKKLAFVSKTPGKTVSLNFYQYGNSTFVDTPGYGFAGKSEKMNEDWTTLVSSYLTERRKLKMCYILIDSRRGLMENDIDMLLFIDELGQRYTIVYTKIDKINRYEQEELRKNDQAMLSTIKLSKLYIPDGGFIMTSSDKRIGIKELVGNINLILSSREEI